MIATNEITHYSGTPGIGAIGEITIHRLDGSTVELSVTGKWADDGFTWGYSGSGPKETAYALLNEHVRNESNGAEIDDHLTFAFINEFVATWPAHQPWAITPLAIGRFIERHRAQ